MSGNVIHTLACVCTLGFEDVCVRELRGRLADASEDTIEVLPSSCAVTEGRVVVEGRTLYRGDTGCATVLVSTNRDPNSLIHATRSIPYWFAYLAHSATLPTATNGGSRTVNDADHAELELIPELLRRADWISALRTWRAHIGTTDKDDDAPPSFAGRCVRGGNHSFNSQDVALKIGQGVGAVFPSWKVDLKNPAVEVIAIILNETVFLGLHLRTPRTGDKHFNKCKFPTEVRPAIPARTLTTAASSSSSSTSAAEATALAAASAAVGPTVKPSTAFLMLSLLQLHPHELVVDVTCSIGTALIEAAIGHACVALGGDCDERLAPIQRNAASLGGSSRVVEPCLWGARLLPLREAVADAVVLEVPWSKTGQQKQVPKYCQRTKIPTLIEQIARVLVPSTGRVVILIQSHQHLVAVLDSKYFCDVTVRGANIGGFICSVVTAKRTGVLWREPMRGTDTWDKQRLSWYEELKETKKAKRE